MKRFFNKIISVITVAWGRTPVGWLWKTPKNELDTLLLIASRHYNPKWAEGKLVYLSQIMYFFMLIAWPIRAATIIFNQSKRFAPDIKKQFRISYLRQLSEQLNIAFFQWTNPEIYYLFDLYKQQDMSKAKTFLLENHMTACLGFINRGKSESHVDDKHRFNQDMKSKGFPIVNDIAMVRGEGVVDFDGVAIDLPEMDFIAKPNIGLGGNGLLRMEWLGNDQYSCSNDQNYSKKDCEKYLSELSQQVSYLIQPRMINHPEIADLSGGSFATCRIVTGMTPAGSVEVILAVYKIPLKGHLVDNFGAGGIASPVDLNDGILGRAVYKYQYLDEFENHPDNNALICGRKLPYWKETIELVKNAHKQVEGEFAFLGWDIGICEDGPVIVETQVTFGFLLCQRPGLAGIGSTRLPHIYVQWLKQ